MTKQDAIKLANDMAFMGSIWIDDDGNEINDLAKFAQMVSKYKANELADKIEKMPFGDTAASFAVWIREQA